MQDAHLAETRQSLRPIRPEHQQRQRKDQQFEKGENFDYWIDRKTGWRYHREPRGNPQAASSSSTSQWPTSQWQTSWNSWQPRSSEKWWWFLFPGRNSRKSTGGCRQDTHSRNTSVQYSLFTSAERTPRAWLKSHGSHFVVVRLKRICHLVLHMSHPCWSLPHPPFTTSKSSSSFTLPSTTTQEHEAQPVQQEPLREHPVHHAHLQAPSVDKLRHQESLQREDLQSGGNPRTTTPTGYEPKELATVSRIEDYSGDPYQLYDVLEKLEK